MMDRILHFCGCNFLIFLLGMGIFVSCHPPQSNKDRTVQSAHLSTQDSLLGEQFPFDDYYQVQKELLLKYSKPPKRPVVPDGKHYEGNFSNGVVELIFDEIRGEPNYFHGHLEEPDVEQQLEFIIFDIPNAKLDKLVSGQKYRVYWIETVVNTAPFDDDRYRDFLMYRIDE